MRFPRSLTLLMAAFCFAQSQGALAEEPELKPAVPLLDAGPTAEPVNAATLKGTVEHHANQAKAKLHPRLPQKAKVATQGPLSGRANSDSPKPRPLSLRADYTIDRSIGIIGIVFAKKWPNRPRSKRFLKGRPQPRWASGLRTALLP